MKLRQPNADPPSCDFSTEPGPGIWREFFDVTTLTPIYGGGVKAGEPDPFMPVRAAAIRGQLRFWWRLLKQHHPEKPLTGAALFDAEREIWGGMAEKNRDYASKVRVRVSGINPATVRRLSRPCAEYQPDHRDTRKYKSVPEFIPEAHPYALFPAQGKLSEDRTTIEQYPASIILPGLKFTLTMECQIEFQQEIFETLRWWASFGGIGARTRRGLGAIQVQGLSPVTEASKYGCKLIIRDDLAGSDGIDSWHQAINALKNFRQGNKGRNRGGEIHPGRSYWPEPEAIRAVTGQHRIKADGITSFQPANPNQKHFPRAAFGLPIIFHFQNIKGGANRDQAFDPDDCELKPTDYDRMASPLILKPTVLPNGQFAPMALRLPIGHLTDLRLQLRNSGNRAHNPKLPQDLPAGTWWPVDLMGQQAAAQSVRPLLNYQGQDALTAFLNYFARG